MPTITTTDWDLSNVWRNFLSLIEMSPYPPETDSSALRSSQDS